MRNLVTLPILALSMMGASVLPAAAQIDTGVDFKTSFAFYAQNTKLPAGAYTMSRVDFDENTALLESTDGKHSVFLEFIPTEAEHPHAQSDVTFHKYGDVDYLNRIWVAGQTYGIKVETTTAEKKAAGAANFTEHSIIAQKH